MSLTRDRYHFTLITLHWLTLLLLAGACISVELSEAWPKGSAQREAVRQWHYWMGIAVWVLLWPRLLLCSVFRRPPIVPAMSVWQVRAARVMHVALYLFMLLMPIVGWLTLSARGQVATLAGWSLPSMLEANRSLAHSLKEVHESLAAVGYTLTGLHAAAALFHHVVLRDNTLMRMLPALIALLFVPASHGQAQDWLLMGRHGECVEVSALERKLPEARGTSDPQVIAQRLRDKGIEVKTEAMALPAGHAISMAVPTRGLDMVFVPAAVCQSVTRR
jgi:cytochrome b561